MNPVDRPLDNGMFSLFAGVEFPGVIRFGYTCDIHLLVYMLFLKHGNQAESAERNQESTYPAQG